MNAITGNETDEKFGMMTVEIGDEAVAAQGGIEVPIGETNVTHVINMIDVDGAVALVTILVTSVKERTIGGDKMTSVGQAGNDAPVARSTVASVRSVTIRLNRYILIFSVLISITALAVMTNSGTAFSGLRNPRRNLRANRA